MSRRLLTAAVVLFALFVLAPMSSATTYIMVADEDLVDGADRVGVVRVLASRTLRTALGIATEYDVEFIDSFKGAGETIVTLRRPGGMLANGAIVMLHGMPTLQVGEEALVFAIDHGDGTWGFEHLALGLFRLATIDGRRVAYRMLEAAPALEHPARAARRESLRQAHLPRDLEAFATWIGDRTSGAERGGDYYLPAETIEHRQIEAFTLFDDGNGNSFHWHELSPGAGGSVPWTLNKKGRKGLKQKGVSAIKEVMKAWSKIFNISLTFAGKTAAKAGFTNNDGLNTWLFDDPNGEINGAFDCSTGGVLAIGGFQGAFGPPHGATGAGKNRTYWDIAEGEVIFQNGIDCVFPFTNPERFIEELGGHENGHSLGLGHSCGDGNSGPCNSNKKNDALMRASVHNDNRGAAIKADDKKGAKALDYQ